MKRVNTIKVQYEYKAQMDNKLNDAYDYLFEMLAEKLMHGITITTISGASL